MTFYRWDALLATTAISLVHAVNDMAPEESGFPTATGPGRQVPCR
jgi:hypothetical protein